MLNQLLLILSSLPQCPRKGLQGPQSPSVSFFQPTELTQPSENSTDGFKIGTRGAGTTGHSRSVREGNVQNQLAHCPNNCLPVSAFFW